MRAAKRKWFNRVNAFFQVRRRQGQEAAFDWLQRFDQGKVRKHMFKES